MERKPPTINDICDRDRELSDAHERHVGKQLQTSPPITTNIFGNEVSHEIHWWIQVNNLCNPARLRNTWILLWLFDHTGKIRWKKTFKVLIDIVILTIHMELLSPMILMTCQNVPDFAIVLCDWRN